MSDGSFVYLAYDLRHGDLNAVVEVEVQGIAERTKDVRLVAFAGYYALEFRVIERREAGRNNDCVQ